MTKVVIYNGTGAGQNSPVNTATILRTAGYQVAYASKLTVEGLRSIDVLVIPGGDSGRKYLQVINGDVIRKFVKEGGKLFATCAGAYAASKHVDAPYDYDGWGVAPSVRCKATEFIGDLPVKLQDGKVITLHHYRGPAMYLEKGSSESIAWFNDAKTGFKSYVNIAGDTYGKGRVVLCSSHPELAPQHPEIIIKIMDYLLAKTESGSETVTEENYDKKSGYQILKADFQVMIKAVTNFVKEEKRNPNKVYLRKNGKKLGSYITWTKYQELLGRWTAFQTKEGREPKYITIVNETTPAADRKVGPIQKFLEDGTGIKFNSITEFYNKIILPYGKYSDPMYFDDKKTIKKTAQALVNNVKGKTAGFDNQWQCVDGSQLVDALAREMGYTSSLWSFRCIVEQINHAVCLIDGKEFSGKKTVIKGKTYPGSIVDPAAAAESGYKIGQHWCSKDDSRVTKQPGWLPTEKWS